MGDKERRVGLLRKFAATSTVSASLVVSGFLLSGCVVPPIIMYVVDYVEPDGAEETVPPEADLTRESGAAEEDVIVVQQ
jgi:hypothetical protein